jgi:hypothetical protein
MLGNCNIVDSPTHSGVPSLTLMAANDILILSLGAIRKVKDLKSQTNTFRLNLKSAKSLWGDLSKMAIQQLKRLTADSRLTVVGGDLQVHSRGLLYGIQNVGLGFFLSQKYELKLTDRRL